jgi:hypothetical protein
MAMTSSRQVGGTYMKGRDSGGGIGGSVGRFPGSIPMPGGIQTVGGAQQQQQALTKQQPMEMEVKRDPELQRIMGEMKDYRKNLSTGTDVDAINSMMRQRDAMSGIAKEFGAQASQMGAMPGSGASSLHMGRLFGQGQRDLSNLNAQNVSDARNKQMAALRDQAGVGGQMISGMQGQQNFLLDQWRAQRQAAEAEANLALRREEGARDDMLQLMNMYTG